MAADAGLSPALVLHHFGSKQGLREACDDHVLALVAGKDVSALLQHRPVDPTALAEQYDRSDAVRRYLARALTDGSPAAARLFDEIAQESARLLGLGVAAGTVTPTQRPADRAAVLLAMQLGTLVLHEHLGRALGVDVLAPAGAVRVARAMLEVLGGLLDADAHAAALAALDEETSP